MTPLAEPPLIVAGPRACGLPWWHAYGSAALSLLLHGTCAGGFYAWCWWWGDYRPPELLLKSQRVAIALKASIAAAPKEETIEREPPIEMPPPPKKKQPEKPLPPLEKPEVAIERKTAEIDPLKRPPPRPVETVLARAEIPPEWEAVRPAEAEQIESVEVPPRRKPSPLLPLPEDTQVRSDSVASQAVEGSKFDELPRADVRNKKPPYPQELLVQRQRGEVMLQLRINQVGAVESVMVLASSGLASFDRSALETARGWRFQPARLRGNPVAAHMDVLVRFTPPG